jgi:carboxymethylenebutenolidase
MCYPAGALPPDVPRDLRLPQVARGAGGSTTLVSADGTKVGAYIARAPHGDAGVVICPDVRGLHRFYEELADRFASADVHAIAFDYFGRTAGTARRPDDFEYVPHVRQTTPRGVFADIDASRAELASRTGAKRIFVLGFCFGGRIAFLSSAERPDLAGVIGFYGRLSRRDGERWPVPAEAARRMRAPVLGLFGGADPGIPPAEVAAFTTALNDAGVPHHIETYPGAPHSFFDRSFTEHRMECDDAWRRVLTFIRTGEPTSGESVPAETRMDA